MVDWQQYTQSIIFGLIFSYLVSKLISLILSFRHHNLRLTRSTSSADDDHEEEEEEPLISKDITHKEPISSDKNNDSSDSDDDWEGVESTELDETFSAATAFVAATAADKSSQKVSSELQLQLYGLYKIATEGPCSAPQPSALKITARAKCAATAFVAATAADKSSQKVSSELQLQLYGLYKIATEGPCSAPQPSALKITARAKWNAWQKLGAMPPEEAMIKYIEIITQLYPTWAAGSTSRRGENDNERSNNDTRPMGPVFSSFIHEEESDELKLDAIHAFAREGDTENLIKCVESGVPVDTKDSEGRTPLHWAVDRGHVEAAELLLSRNADVNTKDNEGQTPLHYAAVCERELMAELLVKNKAATDIKDDDGNYPSDLCDSKWPWIQPQVPSFDS